MLTKDLGGKAEAKALNYLEKNGLKLITKNYFCAVGELDLIMSDKEFLVFIEVRSRKSMDFGGGAGSITGTKIKKIIKAACHYIMKHKISDEFPRRFDVVSIDGISEQITWIKNAFGTDY